MTKARTYKSETLAAIHETVADMFAAGVIDKTTMRRFDEACLTPVRKLTPTQISRIRERERASQEVFALHLNVSKGTVSQWERGEKMPSGAALKLLSLIDKNGLSSIA